MIKKTDFHQSQTLSTDEMRNSTDDPNVQIIDIRPIDAYNGWQLQNEPRGGHIKGARTLPFKWSNYIDWIEIVRGKNILPSFKIILYGYDTKKTEHVAHTFYKAGYTDLHVYHDFTTGWSPDPHLPMEQLPRYQHLVSPQWLHELITIDTTSEYNNKKYVICHAHYQNRSAYEEGHIPNAIDLDTNLLESSDTWNRRSPQELHQAFQDLGITHDTTVILYGRFSFPNNSDPFPGSSAGHLGAFRCAMIMMYAGVNDVRILNGGLQSWMDEGYQTTTQEYKKHPVQDFGVTIPAHPEYIIDLTETVDYLQDPMKNLVSVRSWREFIGQVSGYNYIEKKGRIPGAIFGNCGSDAYHMENYRNLDHTTREYHEIEHLWAEAGITPDKHNAFYCGTGWRGSEAFFNAWLMGWPHVAVFDGGWYEWTNAGYPYETGNPNQQNKQMLAEGNYS